MSCLNDPAIRAAFERSNIKTDYYEYQAKVLDATLQAVGLKPSEIADVSQVEMSLRPDGSSLGTASMLLVLTRQGLAITEGKGVFKFRIDTPHTFSYSDDFDAVVSIEDTRQGGGGGEFAIQAVVGRSEPVFRIGWDWWSRGSGARAGQAAMERDRVLALIERGLGGQLNLPSRGGWSEQDYLDGMQQLVAAQGAGGGSFDPLQWLEDRGALVPGPLFEAAETLKAELRDRADGGWDSRRSRFQRAGSVLESVPAATVIFLPLGEQLYDAGALNGPYAEFLDADDFARDGLMMYDPGPRRLAPLIMLANLAAKARHLREAEWRDAAKQGIASLSGTRLSAQLTEFMPRLG